MRAHLDKLSLRELRMLLAGIGCIVTAAVAAMLVIPQAKLLRTANAELIVVQRSVEDTDALETELTREYEAIAGLNKQLGGDMANFPIRQVEAYIIGRLQRVSWNNDIELVAVEPAMGDRIQIFQEMLFNVRLVGEYEDLYRWLIDAREELGFVVIKEYALRRQDNVDDAPRLFAQLSLASYRPVE